MGFFSSLLAKVKNTNLILLIVLAFGVYITFFADYNYITVVQYEQEITQLKKEIKACKDSTAVYNQRLQKLDSDPESLERIVREEYLMKRDNEDLYIVNE